MGKKTFKPGEPAPTSAQYRNASTGNEITGVKGKPLPPTREKGQKYVIADVTKHKK